MTRRDGKYDTERTVANNYYVRRFRLEPSGVTLSLDAIIDDYLENEEFTDTEEEEEITSPEDTR